MLDREEYYGRDVLFIDPPYYDKACIGISYNDIAIYSLEKLVEILVEHDGMTDDQAIEYIDYNICGAYVGEHTPIIMSTEFFNYR